MAKANVGRASSASVKVAPPGLRKKAKPVPAASKKTAVAKQAAKTSPSKTVAARGNGSTTKTAGSLNKASPAKVSPKQPAPAKGHAKAAVLTKQPVRKSAPLQQSAPPRAQPAKPAAKAAAAKKIAPRRPPARNTVATPPARRARATAPPRNGPIAPQPRKPPAGSATAAPQKTSIDTPRQVFTVSHLSQTDFKVDGLRAYAQYRDLGIAAASGGLCQAHVIRFTPPCTDEVRKRHVHQADLQLIYVLQGWMKNEFEGHGEQMMSAGSCWLQPSGIRHTVLDYSADCEVLEIIVPADFKTQELA